MLTTGIKGEAVLELTPNLSLKLYPNPHESATGWVMQVQDSDNQLSWLDLLFKYEFLKDWYLENLDTIEVKTDSRYF